MPTFYFDYITLDDAALDDSGTELTDDAMARAAAIRAAGEWIKETTARGKEAEVKITVRSGESARPLWTVIASITVVEVPEE
jgi:hypothetical protein